jgi:hypothetical protein
MSKPKQLKKRHGGVNQEILFTSALEAGLFMPVAAVPQSRNGQNRSERRTQAEPQNDPISEEYNAI